MNRLEDKYEELTIIRGDSKLIAFNHKLVMIGLGVPSFLSLSAFYRHGHSNTIGFNRVIIQTSENVIILPEAVL